MQGEISATANWCEDTFGINDPNGPSMVVNGRLSNPGKTDIVTNSPSYISPGTFTVSVGVGLNDAGVSGSYSVPNVQEQLIQVMPYTSFEFEQALNTGPGCNGGQSAYYWDFAQGLESIASSSPWPRDTFTHFGDTTGHFWCIGVLVCDSGRYAVEAGFYFTFQGTG
jgi:hypothetical protein